MKILSHSAILLTLLVVSPTTRASTADVKSDMVQTDSLDVLRFGVVASATVTGFTVGHVLMNNLWWKGEDRVPFHFNTESDYLYALNADKLGHAFFANAVSTTYGALMLWCGMDSTAAVWTGFGVAMTYQTYVEVRDGFSAAYGFSWGDMAANTAGALFPVAKRYLPFLRNTELQISYFPSPEFKSGEYSSIIDDYESTTHWLAVTPFDWLPESWQTWYPPWLGVAVGHSVDNLDGLGGGNHRVFVSLDFAPSRIRSLPHWLRDVLSVMHLYHLPAPAIEVYPTVVWYGLKF